MIRVSQILFWLGLTIAASLALYHTSDRVHVLDCQLRDLNAQIEDEQKSLHVLKAEWVYLANPVRLESTAHKFLALRPTVPQQVVKLDELGEVLAAHNELAASLTQVGAPVRMANAAPAVPDDLKNAIVASASPTASIHKRALLPPHFLTASTRHVHDKPASLASKESVPAAAPMVMRTASAAPVTGDSIGALLASLGSHP